MLYIKRLTVEEIVTLSTIAMLRRPFQREGVGNVSKQLDR